MSEKNKLIATKRDYIKALLWFRGGTVQDNIDTYNYWLNVNGGHRVLNSYLEAYLKQGYADILKQQEEEHERRKSKRKRNNHNATTSRHAEGDTPN